MLRPAGFRGAAFSDRDDGDPFVDANARRRIAVALGISDEWATVTQVHGASVAVAGAPGDLGEADAVITGEVGLPLAVKTADCVPIVLEAEAGVGVVHAGWRGLRDGIVTSTVEAMRRAGHDPERAAIGPAIGPCCYEVGPEVTAALGHISTTRDGSTSVNLAAAAADVLRDGAGVDTVWAAGQCTMCSGSFNSHRQDGTPRRQAGIGWLP